MTPTGCVPTRSSRWPRTLPSGRDLASQSTMCRLENLPGVRELVAMGRAMVDLYCASFRQVPKRIVLDIDDTFDAVHGGQQLRLFNAHHDEYGFQPIVVFDGAGRFVGAVLRPAKRPNGAEIRAHLRRLVRAIRSNWPNTRILIRADSHYCRWGGCRPLQTASMCENGGSKPTSRKDGNRDERYALSARNW
jgi:Transposase DDE domain group 1